MALFRFFHRNEREQLIAAFEQRKRKILSAVKHALEEEKKFKNLLHLENHILDNVEKLSPSEKAAVDKVLDENRAEEDIVNYLAVIEKEIIGLLESGNSEAIKVRLRKY